MISIEFLHRAARTMSLTLAVTALAACSTTIPTAFVEQPVVTPLTAESAILRALPPPSDRIRVAVYGFPDLTGQFSESTNGGQTLSNAVTQGGSSLLIKALQDAGERRWFAVLDRASLDDTLKERQIVTEMRRVYRGEDLIDAAALPPLAHAGIIIQGGITGYDSFTKTGGIGARYLGIGGDTKWQQDTVTVNLRAVSTNTSEVLASVTIHKSIASISVQGGIFQYVALDRILEAEAGVTQNEPRHVAVQQAVEKAVVSLILEGAELGVWRFSDRTAGRALIEQYHLEKYGEIIPLNAQLAPPPETRNAAAVVTTIPIPRRARPTPQPAVVVETPAAQAAPTPTPTPTPPPPPPAAGEDEVVG